MVVSSFTANSFQKQKVSRNYRSNDETHIENLENFVELQLPGCDRLFVPFRVKPPRDRAPGVPFDQLLLNVCHDHAIERIPVSGLVRM